MTMHTKNRAQAFATAKNVIGAITTSKFEVSHDTLSNLRKKLMDDGFIAIKTSGEETHAEAQKLWEEMYNENCIVVVIHNRIAKEIADFAWFEHFLRTNDIVGEEFFVWYADIEEIRKMAEKAGTSCLPA